MALLLKKIYDGYDIVFNQWGDSRTSTYPLMGSPFPTLAILIFYLYFVKDIGPKIMAHREPFKLKKLMILYNIIQIIGCTYLVWRAMKLGWAKKYRWICEPIDFSNNQEAIDIATTVYMYYIVKLTDLLDTGFFVFRKKQSHVSFLHVYHHTGMVVLGWSATKYVPGGHGTSLGVINSIVHIVMYSYYLLSLIDSKYKKSLWWKKHITQLQIVQFLLLALHFTTLITTPNCDFPIWVAFVIVPQNLFMLALFLDFYRKNYVNPKPKLTNGFHKDMVESRNGENCNGYVENHKSENSKSN